VKSTNLDDESAAELHVAIGPPLGAKGEVNIAQRHHTKQRPFPPRQSPEFLN